MATFETNLITYLNAEIPSIKFYSHIPEKRSYPAACYQLVANPHDHNLDGAAGVARARIQFSFFSYDQADTEEQAELLRVSLDGYHGAMGDGEVLSALLQNELCLYEQPANGTDEGIYHRVVDYMIKHRVTIPSF